MKDDRITVAALRRLSRELGPVGMVRFLQQFDTGAGDYTAERYQWLGDPKVQELVDEIAKGRSCRR